jgi:predicted ribonuclease YlaK
MLTHTYLRGTNLKNKVVILDESQNYTVAELKKVLTRCHDSCKVIVIGHTGQIDISGGSGFARYLMHFENEDRAAVCKLSTNHRGWLSTFADQLW